MTDEHSSYKEVGREFVSHDAVNHSKDEYVRYWNEVTTEIRPMASRLLKPPPSPQTRSKDTIRFSSAA